MYKTHLFNDFRTISLSRQSFFIGFSALFCLMEIYFFCFNTKYFFSLTPWLLFFLISAFSFNRTKVFFRDWLVFISQLLFFNFLRSVIHFLITLYDLPVYSQYIISFESLFTPSNSLANILQAKLTESASISWLESFCAFIYSSHFACFLVVGFCIWYYKPKDFWRFKYALISTAYLGLVLYLVVPTIPPWLASQKNLIPEVRNIFNIILSNKFGMLIKVLDTNPIAAMPSLHVAFPTVCLFSLTHHFGFRKIWPFALYLILVVFSTVLLGAHFIGDLLAGGILALFFSYIFYFKSKVCQQYQAEVVKASDIGVQYYISFMYFTVMIFIANLVKSIA